MCAENHFVPWPRSGDSVIKFYLDKMPSWLAIAV